MTPLSPLTLIGVNYRTASAVVRERFNCALADLEQIRRTAPPEGDCPWAGVRELALLRTCHRLELYASLPEAMAAGPAALTALWAAAVGAEPADLRPHLYAHSGRAAAVHLGRVAAGLESLALGEPQILGQVAAARQAGRSGLVLDAVFRAAIRAGRRARRETAISAQPTSLSALALAEAQQRAGDLRRRPVLVIGLGEVGQSLLKGLHARNARQVAVTNRTLARAEQLAARYGYQAYPFSDLAQALAAADVVFSATAAPQSILNPALVETALAARPERPLLLVDLAVPPDVAPEVAELAGVRLLHLDGLRASLDQALAGRRQAIPQVEAIIAMEVAALEQELQQLAVRPVIASLRQQAEAIRRREIARARRHLGDVDAETWGHIQQLSLALVNQLLHEPTVRLKEKAGDQEAAAYTAAVRELFNLP